MHVNSLAVASFTVRNPNSWLLSYAAWHVSTVCECMLYIAYDLQISSVSRSCFYHIRDIRRIRSVLDFTTAQSIGTFFVHSRLDYCNSLYYGLPKIQLNHLQHIQNSLARAVVAARRSSDANQILKSLHWLKVPDHIEYKVNSVTYKLLPAPHYLRDLITIQSAWATRSSSLVTLLHLPVQSNLKITKRSFRHAAPHLWNKLPPSLCIPSTGSIPSFSDSHHGPVCHLSYGAFHSRLKTNLFFKSFPP